MSKTNEVKAKVKNSKKSSDRQKNSLENNKTRRINKSGTSKLRKLNLLLIILIIISFFVLMYRITLPTQEHEFEPKLPTEGIINIHEHIHRFSDADKWMEAMAKCGVSTTIMLGSPEVTFLLNSPPGFNNYSKNNDMILNLEEEYDSKILAFPTIDPRDPNKLEVLKDQLDKGAIGLKLYSGHTGEIFPEPKETLYDYLGPLNRSDMYPVYEYCEKNNIPIIWHIKLKWDYLFNETIAVLNDFPNLIVNIPHFGVLGAELERLEQLMENYSGVYTDISFGGFAKWGLPRVSNNIEVFREFVLKFHDRVMLGTDMVVTNNVRKTVPWIVNLTMGYRHMLEKDEYYINVPNITGEGEDDNLEGQLKGLGLDQDILDEIYFETPLRFLKGEPGEPEEKKVRAVSIVNDNFTKHIETNVLLSNGLVLVPIKDEIFCLL